jgi:hypothetical protein
VTRGPAAPPPRARRLRAPLLLALALLLAFEALGGLTIFFARLAYGITPGETLHVVGGVALTLVYAVYQIQHFARVAPLRARLDYAVGLIAASAMIAANGFGLMLGTYWWKARIARASAAPVAYPPLLSALHNIASLLVLTFALAHLGAVLARDRRAGARSSNPSES